MHRLNTVFVLFDSLNRTALGCYGANGVHTPNFDRFARRAVAFDRHYVGSLPCMPARRDLHTGRLSFMHRPWGPLEPFDNSFPALMRAAGVYTHLITDHLHYFKDGGATYHGRFQSWEFFRGQEDDAWKAMVQPPLERFREKYSAKQYRFDPVSPHRQNVINRQWMRDEAAMPGPNCFAAALEFLELNHTAGPWFLQVECFDPHEPFDAPPRFRDLYPTGYTGKVLDWPQYERATDSALEIAEIRANYAALVTMSDHYFGKLLDAFDRHGLWNDTILILSTDHGFLLAEHEWWGKNRMPYYVEISHIPLLVYHPAHAGEGGSRRQALTQTIDLMPTFLNCFEVDIPKEVQGHSLLPLLAQDRGFRTTCLFGMFGGPLGACDGRYVHYLYPPDLYAPGLYQYTLMPMHLRSLFTAEELRTAELAPPFDFTKGMPVLRVNALKEPQHLATRGALRFEPERGTVLYDLQKDPQQAQPFREPVIEERFHHEMAAILGAHDAPAEFYDRYGLDRFERERVKAQAAAIV